MVLKRRFLFALVLALGLMATRGGAAEELRLDRVRLHVVAADDSEAAQTLKLRVRDAVLERARDLLASCRDANGAWARVNAGLAALEDAAAAAAEGEKVRVETGVFAFPDRLYGGTWVPAGRYRAVRVVLGAGRGRNWWCVLYPSLCLPEEYRDGSPVRFHSVLLDWLRELLGGESA